MITPEQKEKIKGVLENSNFTPPTNDKKSNSDWFVNTAPKTVEKEPNKIISGLKTFGNALISSEKNFGESAAQAIFLRTGGAKKIIGIEKQEMDTGNSLFELAKKTDDEDRKRRLLELSTEAFQRAGETQENIIGKIRTNSQILGSAGGVLIDTLLAGSFGAKGAITGQLLKTAKATQVAAPVVKATLGQTLKNIGKETFKQSIKGAGIGFGFDVTSGLQEGETGTEALKPGFGTVLGGALPIAIGGIKTGIAITKSTAPIFINSLVKPKRANFVYGKDPGRTVSEMGITGNNLDDFANNVNTAKNKVGTQIGQIYSSPANSGIRLDLTDEIAKIDDAIREAAKRGKSNQVVVTQLQNTKDALLFEHGIDATGNIIKTSDKARNLTNLLPEEAFNFKGEVASQTKFTGNPSDDKFVNSVLKKVYGSIKEKLNKAVGVNNPEITKLNEQYADLITAELAARNRDAIVKAHNVIPAPIKAGGAAGIIAALSTGGAAIPTILSSITAVVLDKALATTAVKTRIAAWLGSASQSEITKLIQNNPQIKETLIRVLPKFASKLNG